jgi:two-component system cell cycle response regulator
MAVLSGNRTAVAAPSDHPAKAGRPVLVVIAGAELGRRIDLDAGDVEIGREEGLTLHIDSELVSRRHASVQRIGGQLVVADAGSTNGTFVNEQKIRAHRLVDGDQIRVGKVVLKYTECAIEAQYHEQILHMASVDGMTGAFNKRYFEEALARLVSAHHASTAALSLVVFDIDHFKKINDTWGHAAGDAVLKQVAAVVRSQIRERDTFCRVGGEEFALLLEGTLLAAATLAAEFVRGAIEMADFVFEGHRIPVTMSLGVAEYQAGEDGPSLFKRADARLYDAKHGGRNRVCAAAP